MDLRLRTETFGADDQSWLGSEHGTQATESVTLDTSTFTAATHYPDGYFKSGLPLGRITATGKYGLYNGAATDGTETLVGFLYAAVAAPTDNTVDVAGAMLTHGKVRSSRLPVAVDAAGQADVAGSIRFI
ncbi:head decoration protein [Streptomyces pini]|uniref:Bacteriophage lambda head decoration protein D n=1 Tax=Streptomyces pini TaxID=1520580 RepID=A0A1I4BX82_9ACTN|nr:head decoration protein [Streptomyces pini]SFK73255.1 Bacteriophage lambda head decoration protein D [Streptomyces pini]